MAMYSLTQEESSIFGFQFISSYSDSLFFNPRIIKISVYFICSFLYQKRTREVFYTMGSKKRSSNSTDGVEIQKDTPMEDVSAAVSKSLKRKMKKDKEKDAELENGDVDIPSSTLPDSEKPMERKKKRKTFDKERKRAILESEVPKEKQISVNSKADETKLSSVSVSSSGLPEFHISVFKDLASADILVRESAAEALATELLKVQEAYDKLENKDLVEGGLKLEAEKDDGLDNCAPSVRYAVRRLIRGVSSSREVCFDIIYPKHRLLYLFSSTISG